MSVLIRGMDEIPEDGAVLMVKHDDNGKVYIKYAGMMGYLMELERIPEKHGRLIDENNVIRLLDQGWKVNKYPSAGNVYALPAIIEAEGAEE